MKKTTIFSKDNLEEIANAFSQGKIVCIPTDTIYAISCDATNIEAIKKIYQIKKRPLDKTLPIFVADIEMAKEYVEFFSKELELAKILWPGALTLVSKINNQKLPKILISKNKIAVRMPKYRLIQNICKVISKPIIATSANLSSHAAIDNVEEIMKIFHSKIDYIVEDFCMNKKNDLTPSTIIEFTNKDQFKIIRAGKIPIDKFSKVMNIN